MKYTISFIIIVMIVNIISCSSLPAPTNESESLYIGYFEILLEGDREFDNITLKFVSEDGVKIETKTYRGYYYFKSDGNKKYFLNSWKYFGMAGNIKANWRNHGSGDSQGKKIIFGAIGTPNKIIYLGHITVSLKPIIEDNKGRNIAGSFVKLEASYDSIDKIDEAIKYVRRTDKESLWLDYEIKYCDMLNNIFVEE